MQIPPTPTPTPTPAANTFTGDYLLIGRATLSDQGLVTLIFGFIGAGISFIGFLVIIVQLWFTLKAAQDTRRIAYAEMLLNIDELLSKHEEIRIKLVTNAWESGGWPSMKERIEIRSYMGAFERIKLILDKGIIDPSTVSRLYRSRMQFLLKNRFVQNLLISSAAGWIDFIELADTLKLLTAYPSIMGTAKDAKDVKRIPLFARTFAKQVAEVTKRIPLFARAKQTNKQAAKIAEAAEAAEAGGINESLQHDGITPPASPPIPNKSEGIAK